MGKSKPAKKQATPSQRLAAQKPRAGAAPAEVSASTQVRVDRAAPTDLAKPTTMRVRAKFVVHEKREVPEIVDGALKVFHLVHLKAVYEPQSVHHGQATIQGCLDNRMFGLGMPQAEIVMKLESKAIADTFLTGRAFTQDLVEVAG